MNTGESAIALPTGRFEGREAFRQLVRDALACAARTGWRELVLSDADFADWPLGERVVIESLQQWSGAGRRMTLLAASFDAIVRLHPRFVQWRVQWDHLITARKCAGVNATDLPSVLWSERWVVQRLDPVRSNGVSGSEPARLVLQRELLDEWVLARSAPGFPASVLGL